MPKSSLFLSSGRQLPNPRIKAQSGNDGLEIKIALQRRVS